MVLAAVVADASEVDVELVEAALASLVDDTPEVDAVEEAASLGGGPGGGGGGSIWSACWVPDESEDSSASKKAVKSFSSWVRLVAVVSDDDVELLAEDVEMIEDVSSVADVPSVDDVSVNDVPVVALDVVLVALSLGGGPGGGDGGIWPIPPLDPSFVLPPEDPMSLDVVICEK